MIICPCGSFWGPGWDHAADCKLWPGSEWERDHSAQHDDPSEELQAVALWAFEQGMRWRAVALERERRELAARMAAHTHYCWTCSDGTAPGGGCHNCRNTGMDQTPCVGCPGPQRPDFPPSRAEEPNEMEIK